MNINKENLIEKMKYLDTSSNDFKLPSWEELPGLELYMDQVIILLNQYLEKDITTPITQSMVNNYVKLKAIPAPVKKRYNKVHLAYLIVFCTLKQTLSIADIQKIMPVDLEECEVVDLYTAFLSNRQKAFEYASKQTEKISKDLFVSETEDVGSVCDVIMQISCVANVFKILTDKILYIKEDEPEKEKAEK